MYALTETLVSSQGHTLALYVFSPKLPNAKVHGVVLVAPAMGVPQRYYAKFANWLSEQGFIAVTFEYSGMGESLQRGNTSLKKITSNIFDWANEANLILHTFQQRYSEVPLYWVGHSMGGQLIGLVDHGLLRKAVTVATGSGYWKENSPKLRQKVPIFWYLAAPILTPIFGYFPGKRLKMVDDLPKGVIKQWRQWCLHPQYMMGVEGERMRMRYASVKTPITALSFTDDDFMSERNTEQIHSFYTQASKKMLRIAPKEIDQTHIGHFGFFKEQFKDSLWTKLLAELN